MENPRRIDRGRGARPGVLGGGERFVVGVDLAELGLKILDREVESKDLVRIGRVLLLLPNELYPFLGEPVLDMVPSGGVVAEEASLGKYGQAEPPSEFARLTLGYIDASETAGDMESPALVRKLPVGNDGFLGALAIIHGRPPLRESLRGEWAHSHRCSNYNK